MASIKQFNDVIHKKHTLLITALSLIVIGLIGVEMDRVREYNDIVYTDEMHGNGQELLSDDEFNAKYRPHAILATEQLRNDNGQAESNRSTQGYSTARQ